MSRAIVLDSGPLGLLMQRRGIAAADACRAWLEAHLIAGQRVIVPEIVDYELRRELIRLGKSAAVSRLDAFNRATPDRYLKVTTGALRLAADLWAQARRRGTPTSHAHALDVDVILVAQVLDAGIKPADFAVATSNLVHLAQFVPADEWSRI